MPTYNIISEADATTVVAAYRAKERQSSAYQSEADLERALIAQLQAQGYEYLPIHVEQDLLANLRRQIERLNQYTFADADWDNFCKTYLTNPRHTPTDKTDLIQNNHICALRLSDGTTKNIRLIDKQALANNSLQVINQYIPDGGEYDNRYDVTILVNGLPMVHIELKRRGVALKEAFNQIKRYQRESFWSGCGLYNFVHIFVISNGTETKYYSNTTRYKHIEAGADTSTARRGQKVASNSFEFTSYWADRTNRIIPDLVDFTATFFNRLTLLSILTRYCVLTADHDLLVMRPYQICATEAILRRILISSNRKELGSTRAGGYIWHTTGSGKTLTSFKTAQLAARMPEIDKVLFVVDRKDLDYQTMREYDRFEKGAANSNTDTAVLRRQLENPAVHIIITTIQKLSLFVRNNAQHPIYTAHVVMIFDECHRSQFGEMHTAIVRHFKRYHIFGFTGTPIFPQNAPAAGSAAAAGFLTTAQAFGDALHTYTIVDAIRDHNVLPFLVSYVSTMREAENISDEQVPGINRERALMSPERIQKIVKYVLAHYDQKTKRNAAYTLRDKRRKGFNSIFCTASIPAAIAYYQAFQRTQYALPESQQLKIALIYSFAANEDTENIENIENIEGLENLERIDSSSREFLDTAIGDYNRIFGTSFDTSGDKFQNYYKDVSLRMKNRELDMLIVVNMFLTGFDATTLNTLWVDKNLRAHGLLQAYSRTNRILNSIKTFGNIVCFRNLEKATNDAISLFGDKDAGGLILMRSFNDYYLGYDEPKADGTVLHHAGYVDAVANLCKDFPHAAIRTMGEQQQRGFIKAFGALLRAQNILKAFDQFRGKEIILPQDMQDYQSYYLDLKEQLRPQKNNVDINDDLVFEMELVKQVEINIDYILNLVKTLHAKHTDNAEICLALDKQIASSPDLRPKKQLIEQFIHSLTPQSDITSDWDTFVRQQKTEQLEQIIREEHLKHDETVRFMDKAFQNGQVEELGTDIIRILPPTPLFTKNQARTRQKETVLTRLKDFFARFFDITPPTD